MIAPVPRSLAGRTALAMVAVLVIVQAAGLTIHAMDRVELQRLADGRDLGTRTVALYRAIVAQPGEAWPAIVHDAEPIPGVRTAIEPTFRSDLGPASPEVQRLIRPYLGFGAVPQPLRPKNIPIRGAYEPGRLLQIGLQLPDDRWLTLVVNSPELRPWSSVRFIIAFAIMTATAALIATWSVRRLTDPVRVLANAAERLGRDVNAPPLPEDGPTEVAAAAAAFNTMAARIRRFVADRTFLLTAIGHDLRTPITRLKLRAEWMDDDEQRRKMLADLDELEAMVAATLAFGRDAAQSEPTTRLDLPALLRTILDEAADARPDAPMSALAPAPTPSLAATPASPTPGPRPCPSPPAPSRSSAPSPTWSPTRWPTGTPPGSSWPRPWRARSPSTSRTKARASRSRTSTACSSRSSAWSPAATARPAAPGWACRSRATSCGPMAATSPWPTTPRGCAPPSPCRRDRPLSAPGHPMVLRANARI